MIGKCLLCGKNKEIVKGAYFEACQPCLAAYKKEWGSLIDDSEVQDLR